MSITKVVCSYLDSPESLPPPDLGPDYTPADSIQHNLVPGSQASEKQPQQDLTPTYILPSVVFVA